MTIVRKNPSFHEVFPLGYVEHRIRNGLRITDVYWHTGSWAHFESDAARHYHHHR